MRPADALLASTNDLTTIGTALLMAIIASLYLALTIHGLARVTRRG